MIEFNILGPLQIVVAGREYTTLAPKNRQVLALLLARANQIIGVDEILDELWAGDPPRSAVVTAQTYLCHIRKVLGNLPPAGRPPRLVSCVGPGYALHMNEARSDVELFRRLRDQGQALIEAGQLGRAAACLHECLAVWRGTALADIHLGPVLRAHAAGLKEERAHALELRIEADLQLGRHRELIGELTSLVHSHPLNEWFSARLIEALGRCGRRHEALEVYHSLYTGLYHDLGMVPGREVQELQRAILSCEAR